MNNRTLGRNGPVLSAIGSGCMSMTGGYSDKPDRQEMISLIRAAVDRGAPTGGKPGRCGHRTVS